MRRDRRRTDVSRPAPTSRRLGLVAAAVLLLVGLLTPFFNPVASADEIDDTRSEAARVAGELNEIQGRLFQLDREYSEANAALETTNARIDEAQAGVDATSAELAEQREQFQVFAVQAYVGGNEGPELEALLTSTGDEAPKKTSYLHVATGNRRDLQDQLRATSDRLDNQIADLEATKAEAQTHLDEMAAARDESQEALDQQQAIKSSIDAELEVLVQEEQARLQAEREAAARAQAAEDAARQQAAAQARQTTATNAPAPATPSTPSTPSTPNTPSTPATPTPVAPTPVQPVAPPPVVTPPDPPPVGVGAGAAVAAAQSAVGVPYVPGGASMSGFDCSGLTSWAWAKGGKSLPRTTYGQWAAGQRVSLDALQPGDLVFYAGVSHVGLYVGGGSIIHAPNSRSVVRYDSVYWWGPIDGAVRP